MKKITIKSMSLVNFKGIRSLTLGFNAAATSIYGANGTGKTTVSDALHWVLFGKDSADRKDFGIKTYDAQGNTIERLPHEVSAVFDVDGEEVTLKKCLVEKWTKKRGSAEEAFSGNTVECYYNDVPCSAREYSLKVSAICPEQVFKFITNPTFFTSQKKDVQRAMLMRMAGEVTNVELVGENPQFAELAEKLSGKTVEELKRELTNKKNKTKEAISTIPARMDECKRSMPEERDWEAIRNETAELLHRISDIDAQMADLSKAYNEVAKHKQSVAKELAEVKGAITARRCEMESEMLADYNEQNRQHENAVAKVAQLRNDRRVTALPLPRLENELSQLKDRREMLISEWKAIKAQTFAVPDRAEFVCPTCKRPLEAEDVDAKIEDMRTAFNSAISTRLEHNKALGIETKKAIEAKEAEIKAVGDAVFAIDNEIAETESSAIFKESPKKPDTASVIDADETICSLKVKVACLQSELDNEGQAPDFAELRAQRASAQDMVDLRKSMLQERVMIATLNGRLAQLENEYKESQNEIARLEGEEYLIQQFCKARMEHVESRINGMFKMVRFKMYEKLINGGEAETCEAVIDGVPYSDQNQATKMNAGIDIINAISRAEGITAPIVIDNRESVSEIIPTRSQVINLFVDASKKVLTVMD